MTKSLRLASTQITVTFAQLFTLAITSSQNPLKSYLNFSLQDYYDQTDKKHNIHH